VQLPELVRSKNNLWWLCWSDLDTNHQRAPKRCHDPLQSRHGQSHQFWLVSDARRTAVRTIVMHTGVEPPPTQKLLRPSAGSGTARFVHVAPLRWLCGKHTFVYLLSTEDPTGIASIVGSGHSRESIRHFAQFGTNG